MKKRDVDFLMRLANRAVPGTGSLVQAVTNLDKRIDDLEKKVGGLDDSVDKQVSKLERKIDDLVEPNDAAELSNPPQAGQTGST